MKASGASDKLSRKDVNGLADKLPAGAQVQETTFDKVRRVRSFDDVLAQLREAIYSGRIRPGQRLPGERQLCEEFGVGRPTLREALRSLEAVGLIEVRPGKSGGSYAVTPSESTVGDALAALVNLRGASLEDLAEFRVDFEGENASWAARRADAGDIDARSIVAEARAAATATLKEVAVIDVRWHEALARATKNRLRIGIALGIHEAVLRRHRAAVQPPDADEHSLDPRRYRGDHQCRGGRGRRLGSPPHARARRHVEPPRQRRGDGHRRRRPQRLARPRPLRATLRSRVDAR